MWAQRSAQRSAPRKGRPRCPHLSGWLTRLTTTESAGSAHFSYTHISSSPNPDLRGSLSGHGEVSFTTDDVRVTEVDRDISFTATGNQPLHPISSTNTTDAIVIKGTIYQANPIPGLAFTEKYRVSSVSCSATLAARTFSGPQLCGRSRHAARAQRGGIGDRSRTGRCRRRRHDTVRGHIRTAARVCTAPGAAGTEPAPEQRVARQRRAPGPSTQHDLLQRSSTSRCEDPSCSRRLFQRTCDHGRYAHVLQIRRTGARVRTSEERDSSEGGELNRLLDRAGAIPAIPDVFRELAALSFVPLATRKRTLRSPFNG